MNMNIDLKEGEILVIASTSKSRGVVWPRSGHVEAAEWQPCPDWGFGLFGLPRGCGDAAYLKNAENSTAQVVKVNTSSDYFEFDEVCKFKSGEVVFSGPLHEAVEIVSSVYPSLPVAYRVVMAANYDTAVTGDRGTATAGHYGTAVAGNEGTATAGNGGTAEAGRGGTATAGDGGTAIAGRYGMAKAGDKGTAKVAGYKAFRRNDEGVLVLWLTGTAVVGDEGTAEAGFRGTAKAGFRGVATAKDDGTAIVGDDGVATAGHRGTAIAGRKGTAKAGDKGTAAAGEGGTIVIKRFNWASERYDVFEGHVGENGIQPNVKYRVEFGGKFVEA